jgi:hypothetical protein
MKLRAFRVAVCEIKLSSFFPSLDVVESETLVMKPVFVSISLKSSDPDREIS